MNRRPDWYIVAGQSILGLCLLVCLVLVPHYFFSRNQGGVSNYGTDPHTRLLFVAGFGAAALGTFLAALALHSSSAASKRFRASLFGISLLYLLVMASTFPYKISPAYRHLHEQAAVTLFAGMLAIVVWLLFTTTRDSKVNLALALFFLGFITAALTQAGLVHLLFTAQVVCGFSFGYLLKHGVASHTHLG